MSLPHERIPSDSALKCRTGQMAVEPLAPTKWIYSVANWHFQMLHCSKLLSYVYFQFLSAEMSWIWTGCCKPGEWIASWHGCAFSWICRVYNWLVFLLVSSFPDLTSLLSLLTLWGRTRVVPPMPTQTDSISFSRAHE